MQGPVAHILFREMCPCLLLIKSLTVVEALAAVAATYFHQLAHSPSTYCLM